jgi:hypothetical protein
MRIMLQRTLASYGRAGVRSRGRMSPILAAVTHAIPPLSEHGLLSSISGRRVRFAQAVRGSPYFRTRSNVIAPVRPAVVLIHNERPVSNCETKTTQTPADTPANHLLSQASNPASIEALNYPQ